MRLCGTKAEERDTRASFAQDIAGFLMQMNDPESLDFSSHRLAHIRSWYQAQIDAGELTGTVVAIVRNGNIAYLEAIGTQDREKRVPMKSDSIFWIASMTKPITSVAAMMLVEKGALDFGAPVYRYLPGLKDAQVGAERADPTTGTSKLVLVPAKRPMTVRDLLQHTSGYPELAATQHASSSVSWIRVCNREWQLSLPPRRQYGGPQAIRRRYVQARCDAGGIRRESRKIAASAPTGGSMGVQLGDRRVGARD